MPTHTIAGMSSSQITRCPSCATLFRVVPDQLRVSQGWVRCGQCQQAFDAGAYLLPAQTPEEAGGPAGSGDAASQALPALVVDESAAAGTHEPQGAETAPANDAPSFLRAPKPPSPLWTHPLTRAGLLLLAFVLVLGLALQVVVHERERIAAHDPASRPALRQLCQLLGCKLAFWQQLDALLIDSSSFTKVHGDVYRLHLVLRNTGAVTLASPAIELTLTDMQDAPLLRRVLPPQEFGAPLNLRAGGEFAGALTLGLDAPDLTPRLAGYRLVAFYP